MMKPPCAKGTLLFLACISILFVLAQAWAQEDYPLPPGNPNHWEIPGRTEQFAPEEPQTPQQTPQNIFSAPPPPGNEALEQPSVPAGQAEEKYTGTREFGGIGGTGIGQFGPRENR